MRQIVSLGMAICLLAPCAAHSQSNSSIEEINYASSFTYSSTPNSIPDLFVELGSISFCLLYPPQNFIELNNPNSVGCAEGFGDGASTQRAYNALNSPEFNNFVKFLTNGVDDQLSMCVVGIRKDGRPFGPQACIAKMESEFFDRDPDLIGATINSVSLAIDEVHIRQSPEPSNQSVINFTGEWNVTWNVVGVDVGTSSPTGADSVYFIGDSVTAGFGYCGSEPQGVFSKCYVNASSINYWAFHPGYTLAYCAPPDGAPTNNCSNNNLSGQPWNAPAWAQIDPSARPTVAYSYVLAQEQAPAGGAQIFNWAMTGSTPAHWDPKAAGDPSDPTNGIYAEQLQKIRNSYVVMTLGANPILSDYLDVEVPTIAALKKGVCADTTHTTETDPNGASRAIAAPLHDEATTNGQNVPGVGYCLAQQWAKNDQDAHLRSVFDTLLGNGNRVVVVGYPAVCPWTFGVWQPMPNVTPSWLGGGPAAGNPCAGQNAAASSYHPDPNGGNPNLTQQDQAFYLGQLVNDWIKDIVFKIDDPNIVFASPDPFWEDHQPTQEDAWVFLNDTWVHPSETGHKKIAATVASAMCEAFGHWCPAGGGDQHPYAW